MPGGTGNNALEPYVPPCMEEVCSETVEE